VPAAAGTADLAAADEDNTFKDVGLPGSDSGHGNRAGTAHRTPDGTAAPGADVETPKGE
jgi:hypothetical protein